MAFTHTITETWNGDGREIKRQNSFTADSKVSIDMAVAIAASDLLAVMSLDVSEVKSFYMVCDQDLTVEVNDGAGAGGTIVLLAGQPYIWHTGSLDTFLLETDVTGLYLTNGSGVEATFKLEALVDPTP